MVADLKAFEVSDDFVRGTLFLFAATLMRGPSAEACHSWQQWLFDHNVEEVAEDLLGRMYDSPIQRAIEEFVFKLGVDLPVREMRINGLVKPMYLLQPSNHDLLPDFSSSLYNLASISKLYFAFTEELGRCLAKSEFDFEESYVFGFCFFGMWFQMDSRATETIIAAIEYVSPPVLRFFFELPKSAKGYERGWLPTQIALAGQFHGFSESFIQLAWPYQFRVFYSGGVPIADVEKLTPLGFLDHCYAMSRSFYGEQPDFSLIVGPQIDPEKFPVWTGTKAEYPAMSEYMLSVWGYNPSQEDLPVIELKQINACIVFSQFCSMWKRARIGSVASSKNH